MSLSGGDKEGEEEKEGRGPEIQRHLGSLSLLGTNHVFGSISKKGLVLSRGFNLEMQKHKSCLCFYRWGDIQSVTRTKVIGL